MRERPTTAPPQLDTRPMGARPRRPRAVQMVVIACCALAFDAVAAVPDVVVIPGDLPLVITAPHAGRKMHGRKDGRVCTPEHDLICESGPCRPSRDLTLDVLAPAFQAQVGACLGGKPWFIVMNAHRALVDASRDADDPGGLTCALASPADRVTWDAFFDGIDTAIADARRRGGDRAMLIDIHTYGNTIAAPAPSLIMGTGRPFGTTIPRSAVEDPGFETFFGAAGLRERLLQNFRHIDAGTEVWPRSLADVNEELMVGRHLLKHGAAKIDSVQLEISSIARDDPELAAYLAADAVCAALAPRLSVVPTVPTPKGDKDGG